MRYTSGSGNNLILQLVTQGTLKPFDVYLRKGGVCSDWLYDTVLRSVTLKDIPLDGFTAGDVVGVYFDFKGNQYDSMYIGL